MGIKEKLYNDEAVAMQRARLRHERLAPFAERALDLLRAAGQWYCGELLDGTDRREAIAALLAEVDGHPMSPYSPPSNSAGS